MNVLPTKYFLLTATFSLIADTCWADFTCRTEVQYRWRAESAVVQTGKASATPDPAATPASANGEQTVYWALVERKGPTEEEAKRLMADAALQQRSSADKACKQQHENLATCIANKFSALSSTLNSLTFSARRALEEAVTTDCKKQQGACISSFAGDPVCTEKKSEEEKAEGGEKGEKDKGKKEKKK